MSLPEDPVFSELKKNWVVGWKNIEKANYVGRSFGYTDKQTAVGTTNGAGPTNMQLFMLSPDLVVVHALPGFWHPKDLAHELGFGKKMLALWQDKELTRAEKNRRFRSMQLCAVQDHPLAMTERSGWQDFDMRAEQARYRMDPKRDTFKCDADGYVVTDAKGQPRLKPTNHVVHQRMAEQPFVKYSKFNVGRLASYGTSFYDNNLRVDGKGKNFKPVPRMGRLIQQKLVRELKKTPGKPLRVVR